MPDRKNFLKETLTQESRAYGFTIAFWGSGALLINHAGTPSLTQALMYGLGAVTGFGLLTLYTYRAAFSSARTQERSKLMVLSMIHYLGALIPIAAASYTAKIADPLNFFVTGISTSVLYNLGMLVEEILSERGQALEEKLYEVL